MNTTTQRNWRLFGAIVFWLLPLTGMPLAFGRLTGAKVPLFGMVQLVGFTEIAFISLAILCFNISKLSIIHFYL